MDTWWRLCWQDASRIARRSSGIRGVRQGGVEAPALWGRVAKYVLWKVEEKWKARGSELAFGGELDNECVLRSVLWADNYWLVSDSQEKIGVHGERLHRRALLHQNPKTGPLLHFVFLNVPQVVENTLQM